MKRAHMKLCVDPNGSISSFAVFASFILDPLSFAPFPWYPIFSNAPPISWLTPFLDDLDRSSLLLVCRKTQGLAPWMVKFGRGAGPYLKRGHRPIILRRKI
jgi:hypothetical protein